MGVGSHGRKKEKEGGRGGRKKRPAGDRRVKTQELKRRAKASWSQETVMVSEKMVSEEGDVRRRW